MIAPFRNLEYSAHAGFMGFEQAAIDLAMACVVASLISIVLFLLLSAGMSVRTVAGARQQTRRMSPYPGQMSRWCSVSELAEVDRALDQIMAEERTARPGLPGG